MTAPDSDAYVRHLIEIDRLYDELDRLRDELDLTRDTLRRRTQSHDNLVATRLACPHCSTLPLKETPSE